MVPTDPAVPDPADPFARFRAEFFLPKDKIYLDGNSLGLLSRRAEAGVLRVLDEWRALGISGWTETKPPGRASSPWLTLAETAAEKLAPLVGAAAEEICVTGQTTANLHQLLATLFECRGQGDAHVTGKRPLLLGDALNFPSDTYALQSHLRLRGLDPATHLRVIPSRDGRILRLDDILAAFTDDVQLAVLPSVIFTSGQWLDVATITRKAHERGIVIGWDLSHSIGVVPHDLKRDAVDFAFWSNYKWLNAGPGAVGGLYLNRRHFGRPPGLAGWWGVRADRRFAMSREHAPAAGAAALHVGTPHILSLAPLIGSLELIDEAGGIETLRAQSLVLTDYLAGEIERRCAAWGFTLVTPRSHRARGGHLAIAHPEAWRICQALKAEGVIPDFRPPDLIRLAPSPLYTSVVDCSEAIARLVRIMETRAYETFSGEPGVIP